MVLQSIVGLFLIAIGEFWMYTIFTWEQIFPIVIFVIGWGILLNVKINYRTK